MMRTVLVLGGGLTQCDAIASARRLGLRVVVADGNPHAPGMVLDDEGVVSVTVSFTAVDELLAELERRGLHVDAVLPYGSDLSVLPASRVARRLGCAGIDLDPATACTDKVEMRRRWRAAGLPVLPHAVATTASEARRAALELGLPVVVKPPDNAAQRGVQLVTEPAALDDAAAEALANSPSGRVLVEQYVEGPEIAVTTFSSSGVTATIQVTDRVTGPPPYLGICLAHVYPSELPPDELAAVEELLPRAADSLGVTDGPTYSQVRLRDGVPYVLETGARLGGGRDSELRHLMSGQDAIAVHLRLLMGETIDVSTELDPAALVGGGCVQFLTAPPGRLVAVHGLEGALAASGVRNTAFFYETDQVVPPLSSGAARVGYLIATGRDRAEAVERAAAASAMLRFEIDPPARR